MKKRWHWGLLLLVLLLASRFVAFERGTPIDPAGTSVWVMDHGYHSGLIVSRDVLEEHGSATSRLWLAQFPDADWFEFGWGDSGFYFAVPTFSDVTFSIAARALLLPTKSVLHIATGPGEGAELFTQSDKIELRLSDPAMDRLLRFVEAGAEDGTQLGPGLYAVSAFYPGKGRYHLFQTCNSWVSQALRAAGIASAPGPAVLSNGLLADLKFRYGP